MAVNETITQALSITTSSVHDQPAPADPDKLPATYRVNPDKVHAFPGLVLQGARQLGVRTEAIRIVAFSLNGCMAALAGIVFASQIGFIPNQTGTGLEMKAIAACVLGGISLLGGSGAIIGAVLGAWFLTQIDSVLVLLRIPAWWNDFIAGLVLLAVLVFDGRLRCALERNLRRQKYARFMTPPPSVKPASSGKKREAA